MPDRIINIGQPWLRPIVRGKAKAPVEFGAKLDISVGNGFTRLDYHSFDAYNETLKLSVMIERYKERTGSYSERILADKIYRNRENLAYCAERKIRLSGPALGRPKKDEIRDKKQDYIDEIECFAAELPKTREGSFYDFFIMVSKTVRNLLCFENGNYSVGII